ncbi:peptide chain release factor N(5)-glutamine methyltransferase [Kordia sp.]|uniref:peptide chain release factor N(5)-glutamine methyltransferase n=1 Tax=Kordia sp. TaxID=1965332 RepID=UPI003D6A021F
MKLKDIQNIFHKELDEIYGKDEVNSFFFMLTEAYFGLERFALALDPDYVITKAQETPMFSALSELKLQKPIQHILGNAHFFGLDFLVNEHTLIPRPETEELVQWILDAVKKHTATETLRILDIGTGSGCIPIALKKHLPNAKIYALDISESALKVAQKNAKANEVEIQFEKADVLSLADLNVFNEDKLSFDIIVSNPPYVRNLEKAEMQKNVLEFEPDSALFVEDDNPLIFYDRIANLAKANLQPNGSLYFEINQYLGKEMIALLKNKEFKNIELRTDIFGVDRMMKAVKL